MICRFALAGIFMMAAAAASAEIHQDVERCWNGGILGAEAEEAIIVVEFSTDAVGTPGNMRLVSSQNAKSELAAAEAYDAARRAVRRCGPYPNESSSRISLRFGPGANGWLSVAPIGREVSDGSPALSDADREVIRAEVAAQCRNHPAAPCDLLAPR